MAGITPFADSPRNGAWGDRPYAIIDFPGPASYVQFTPGSANVAGSVPTGGQPIGPSNFGLSAGLEGIIMIGEGISSSGNYYGWVFQITSYNQGQPNTTWAVAWFNTSNSVQVSPGTALNNELLRMVGFGPY
jgi:hypothetical protein